MKKWVCLLVCLLVPFVGMSTPLPLTGSPTTLPLGIGWFSTHKIYPSVDGYKYYFGDLAWGSVIYIGKEDLLDMEVELQINFARKKPFSAVLVFGPAGLNRFNCVKKYKEVVALLTRKYKFYRHREIKKDPLIEDLIYVSLCGPVEIGLYEINTEWFTKKFHVTASLFGDGESIWIEIEYDLIGVDAEFLKKAEQKNVLKRL